MAVGGRTSRFGFGFSVNIFPRAGFVAFAGAGGGAAAGVGGRGAVTVAICSAFERRAAVASLRGAPSGSQWSLPAFASAWGPHGTLERQIRKTGFAWPVIVGHFSATTSMPPVQPSAPPFLRPVLERVVQETTARLRDGVIGVPHPGAVQDPGGVRDAPIIRSDPVAEGSSGRGARPAALRETPLSAASRKGTLTAPARTGHVVMASSGWTSKRQTMIAS